MSVLLRQPERFEGLSVVPEVLDGPDLALSHRIDLGHLQAASGPRPAPCQMNRTTTRSPASMKSLIGFCCVGIPGSRNARTRA